MKTQREKILPVLLPDSSQLSKVQYRAWDGAHILETSGDGQEGAAALGGPSLTHGAYHFPLELLRLVWEQEGPLFRIPWSRSMAGGIFPEFLFSTHQRSNKHQ